MPKGKKDKAKETTQRFEYTQVDGIASVKNHALEGWRVVAGTFHSGDWYALMERPYEPKDDEE